MITFIGSKRIKSHSLKYFKAIIFLNGSFKIYNDYLRLRLDLKRQGQPHILIKLKTGATIYIPSFINLKYTIYFQGLNSSNEPSSALRPLEIVAPRIDTYRFSMANLEETQDADLDAILGELCALDSEYDEEISRVSSGIFH